MDADAGTPPAAGDAAGDDAVPATQAVGCLGAARDSTGCAVDVPAVPAIVLPAAARQPPPPLTPGSGRRSATAAAPAPATPPAAPPIAPQLHSVEVGAVGHIAVIKRAEAASKLHHAQRGQGGEAGGKAVQRAPRAPPAAPGVAAARGPAPQPVHPRILPPGDAAAATPPRTPPCQRATLRTPRGGAGWGPARRSVPPCRRCHRCGCTAPAPPGQRKHQVHFVCTLSVCR
jgi:hypothetical protein